MGSRGGKGGGGTQIVEYYCSMLLGVCWGPVTAIRSVYIGEKLLIGTKIHSAAQLNLNVPELHGGAKREGGARGAVWFLPGTAKQFLPRILAAKMYRNGGSARDIMASPSLETVEQEVPAYRDLCCVALTEAMQEDDPNFRKGYNTDLNISEGDTMDSPQYGGFYTNFDDDDDNSGGFHISSNNPYLKPVWVEVTRIHGMDWQPGTAYIFRDAADHRRFKAGEDPSTLMSKPDVNPIHAIRALIVDRGFAAGAPAWIVDDESFKAAADLCFSERLGVSFGWYEQMPVEDMIQMICDHIQAMVFPHPRSGKTVVKMIRGDYSRSSTRVLNASNCVISEISTRDASEVVNEVVVNWTNPETTNKETTVAQVPASIADTGAPVSETHDYHAFCRVDLADWAASRDVMAKTSPLRILKASVAGRRDTWVPGDVVRVNFPDEGLNMTLCRIGKTELPPSRGTDTILHLVEDIFGNGAQSPSDKTGLIPHRRPRAIPPIKDFSATPAPYYLVKAADLDLNTATERAVILASAQETGTYEAEVYTNRRRPTRTVVWSNTSDVPISRRGVLATPLNSEAVSGFRIDGLTPGQPIRADQALVIAPGDNEEICIITQSLASQVGVIRGVLDTVPKFWPAGTEVWVVPFNKTVLDPTGRPANSDYLYGVRPVTFNGTGSAAKEVRKTVNLALRATKPSRPADVRINGALWAGADGNYASVGQAVTVSWANRNRLTEDSVILKWNESTVPPEPGQTTEIILRNLNGDPLQTYTGLTGTSRTFDLPGTGRYFLEVLSRRDGMTSFQRSIQRLEWTR